MKTINKILKLNSIEYFTQHIRIINSVLPVKLTEKEIEILGGLLYIFYKEDVYIFSLEGRRLLSNLLKIDHSNLNKYIKGLTNKGFIVSNKGLETLLPLILPTDTKSQQYNFKIELNEMDS